MSGRTSGRPRSTFYPSVRQRPVARFVTGIERHLKGHLFNCKMCGNCLLLETGFICPMSCPNGNRNGPCRGSSPKRCFVDPAGECVWLRIYERAEQRGDLERLLEINAPLDDRRTGCETLLTVYEAWRRRSRRPPWRSLTRHWGRSDVDWETLLYELRQPDWWQGDSHYHPPAYTETVSKLEEVLRSGQFALSAEVVPPMEPSGERIVWAAARLKHCVHTLNFTDNPLGVPRMSGLACALHSLENGMEPVLQIQTRHRGRHDFQAEVIGASAVGVRNILCLGDDIGRLGPGPSPRPKLSDIDAVQALWILRRLRDEGVDVDGEAIEHRPQYFLGAAASPYAALPKYEAIVTEKKINAGAQFLQTLPVFDQPRFTEWLEALDKRNLLGKAYLMPTIAPLKSPRHARFMANEVPGVYVPPSVMARIENAADPREEGIQIAIELITELKRLQGIRGLHILAPGQEEVVPRLIDETGLKGFVPGARTFSGNGRNHTHPPENGNGHTRSKSMRWLIFDPDDFSGTAHNSNVDL